MAQDFQSGCYYTNKNERVEGLLTHRVYRTKKEDASNAFLFKKDKESSSEKITTKEATAFVVGKDSFAIVSSFFSVRYYSSDFAKVIKKGKINLYLHYADVVGVNVGVVNFIPVPVPYKKTVKTYLIGRAGRYSFTSIDKTNFKDKIESLIFDVPEIFQKFKNGKYKFKNLESLIDEYNLRWKDKKP